MNKENIKDALLSALSLLNNEFESIAITELSDEYLTVIQQIENALKELQENG